LSIQRVAPFVVAFLLAACGSSSPAPPTIRVQPEDRTVSPSQTTTFSVQVDTGGTATTYQWLWNGAAIEGATSPSFTTRPAEVADHESSFTAIIANQLGSVTSRPAILTVSPVPRAPRKGDLRFQGVSAAPFRQARVHSNILCNLQSRYAGVSGTPLALTTGTAAVPPSRCSSWFFVTTELPPASPAMSVEYTGRVGAIGLPELMSQAYAGNGVITSIDLVEDNDDYAWSQVRSVGNDYSTVSHVVSPEDVGSLVAGDGQLGWVVTAVASHAGRTWIVAYDWAGEPPTVYETSVRRAGGSTLGQVASGLASEGYIITAMGRDGAGGLLLVGTRVQGDSMARPLVVVTGSEVPADLLQRGYAIVGSVFDTDTSTWTWIAQQ
jgi:hypothetical protein